MIMITSARLREREREGGRKREWEGERELEIRVGMTSARRVHLLKSLKEAKRTKEGMKGGFVEDLPPERKRESPSGPAIDNHSIC